MIRISDQIRLAILAHASNCEPSECCGLLASDDRGQIRFAYPLTNADHSPTAFTIDPTESYHAFLHADSMGWEISGVFHSHPRGPDVLSAQDIARAADPTWIHLLVCPAELKAFRIENRDAVEVPMSWRDSTPVQIAAGILIRDGRVLMCHRSPTREFFPDVWDLPGGHLDPGESPAAAMAREIEEELSVTVLRPLPKVWETIRIEHLEFSLFIVDSWKGEPRNTATQEHDAIRWVGPDELVELRLADDDYRHLLPRAIEEAS